MWHVKCQYFRNPVEVFNDDDFLRQCIDRSIRLNRDRRPLNENNMRVMLSTFRNTKRVSNFRPIVARSLYERYSGDGAVILDPAAGFGGRLLGALPLARFYVGIEPKAETVRGLRSMLERLGALCDVRAGAEIIEGRAEERLAQTARHSVDLVLTSPPYFSRERYDDSDQQSSVRYPTYSEWRVRFLGPLLAESARALKPGGFLCLNVQNTETSPVANDAKAIAGRQLRPHYRYRMLIGSVPYHRNGNRGGHRGEVLLVFRKPRRAKRSVRPVLRY